MESFNKNDKIVKSYYEFKEAKRNNEMIDTIKDKAIDSKSINFANKLFIQSMEASGIMFIFLKKRSPISIDEYTKRMKIE